MGEKCLGAITKYLKWRGQYFYLKFSDSILSARPTIQLYFKAKLNNKLFGNPYLQDLNAFKNTSLTIKNYYFFPALAKHNFCKIRF